MPTTQRCTSPIHQWKPQSATDSWWCTECDLIIFHPPPKPRLAVKNALSRSAKLRMVERLYVRDGQDCRWCGHPLMDLAAVAAFPKPDGVRLPSDYPTIDHLTPRSKGGSNAIGNLVVSCPPCNYRRADEDAGGTGV